MELLPEILLRICFGACLYLMLNTAVKQHLAAGTIPTYYKLVFTSTKLFCLHLLLVGLSVYCAVTIDIIN